MTALRRVWQYALVLWAAVTLNFALPHLAPGDPVVYLYGGADQSLDPALLDEIRTSYGLDRPILDQYVSFWAGLLRGDLGLSVQHNRPVIDVLADKLPWTLALVGLATLLAFVIGALLGTWVAWRRGTAKETGTVTTVLAFDSMPGFWIGMILIAIFSVSLGWFPSYGATTITATGADRLTEVVSRMVLPLATLTIASVGAFFMMTRASMSSVLDESFVRLARAKGLGEIRIAVGHALRNAMLPVYTTLTLTLGAMLSGAVVVETVFAYPGLGKLIFDAVTARDYPLLQGAFLLATVGIVAANLVADLTYPWLDPRVRRGRPAPKHVGAVSG
ncbi:ABC transporter permease [Mycolicibacterium smegmatis]|uniref:ABC transporter permease n=1 Tax=Mycolicibacterium smegmatis TaxID=1772 RepID=UPI0005D8333A|nr:ABC transporter permease [Mycolicibacterium smegmatis]MCP2624300.1 ABC transporter permease [Mycolicibacterium smegmatis]MDF1898615.1 ABC transporter permease [Mycolicibacterium smegmatis]MDF1908834.1 ABC transporter permease [Mycolicibacterium smegmatis]MDF1915663.1 ABC transporter permease [Mycolicibacterium smegmatis]MDF1927362.1 ABC transporter permease [Mycolicibacterium smegmatis]